MIHGFTILQLGATGSMGPDPGPNYNLIRKQAGRHLTPETNRGDPTPQIQTGETSLTESRPLPRLVLPSWSQIVTRSQWWWRTDHDLILLIMVWPIGRYCDNSHLVRKDTTKLFGEHEMLRGSFYKTILQNYFFKTILKNYFHKTIWWTWDALSWLSSWFCLLPILSRQVWAVFEWAFTTCALLNRWQTHMAWT